MLPSALPGCAFGREYSRELLHNISCAMGTAPFAFRSVDLDLL